jgi:hypothetical protein
MLEQLRADGRDVDPDYQLLVDAANAGMPLADIQNALAAYVRQAGDSGLVQLVL